MHSNENINRSLPECIARNICHNIFAKHTLYDNELFIEVSKEGLNY